jgi:hypothetical protein
MNAYKPRRCSARWLDGDCPREILAIIDTGPSTPDRYDVIYGELIGDQDRGGWLGGISLTEHGVSYGHFELEAHKMADYRYRMAHRYTQWSTLPQAVKVAVRRDVAAGVDA